jgi:YHS domain-containing protein
MKMRFACCAALLAVCFSATVVSAAVKDPKDAACPVSGKNCNPEKHVAFDGGQVYFCCGNCEKAFEADSAKFAAKAHQQMVSTGQLVQKGCPFSGGPVKAGTELAIDGVEVRLASLRVIIMRHCSCGRSGRTVPMRSAWGSVGRAWRPRAAPSWPT